jgi:hypothetical protein
MILDLVCGCGEARTVEVIDPSDTFYCYRCDIRLTGDNQVSPRDEDVGVA